MLDAGIDEPPRSARHVHLLTDSCDKCGSRSLALLSLWFCTA
jgi:hypothetical protein